LTLLVKLKAEQHNINRKIFHEDPEAIHPFVHRYADRLGKKTPITRCGGLLRGKTSVVLMSDNSAAQ